ncbi:PTS sugar transporter subunit IIA [Alteriqipengyuania sp. 357]
MSSPFRLLPQAVRQASCANKRAILAELAEAFASAYALDAEEVLDALKEREALGSTGFGRAVAMPHARLDAVDKPVAVVLHLDHDVDFDAADGVPVRLVMGLISPTDAGVQHLHALAAMSRFTRDERMLHQLFEATGEEELYALVANSGLRDAA